MAERPPARPPQGRVPPPQGERSLCLDVCSRILGPWNAGACEVNIGKCCGSLDGRLDLLSEVVRIGVLRGCGISALKNVVGRSWWAVGFVLRFRWVVGSLSFGGIRNRRVCRYT